MFGLLLALNEFMKIEAVNGALATLDAGLNISTLFQIGKTKLSQKSIEYVLLCVLDNTLKDACKKLDWEYDCLAISQQIDSCDILTDKVMTMEYLSKLFSQLTGMNLSHDDIDIIIDCFDKHTAQEPILARYLNIKWIRSISKETVSSSVTLYESLWIAGKCWYENIRKPGARFYSLNIVDSILPGYDLYVQSTPLSFPFSVIDDRGNSIRKDHVIDLINTEDTDSPKRIVIIGEGGIGKTTSLMSIMTQIYENNYNYANTPIIPLFIELSMAPDTNDCPAYDGNSSTVIHRILYAMTKRPVYEGEWEDLLRMCLYDTTDIAKEEVSKWLQMDHGSRKVVLLLDGVNEISFEDLDGRGLSAQKRILNEIENIVKNSPDVYVIVTSRNILFENTNTFQTFILQGLTWKQIENYLLSSEKSKNEINDICENRKDLINVLRIPLFLTMYVKLNNSSQISTRGELLKTFFHERRNQSHAYSERKRIYEVDQNRLLNSKAGSNRSHKITLEYQWLILDILIPELANLMVLSNSYTFSLQELNDQMNYVLLSPKSLYRTKYAIDYYRILYKKNIKTLISSLLGMFNVGLFVVDETDIISTFCDEFLIYCESSMGIIYEDGNNRYGFIHQHLRDYFAAVNHINYMKVAFTAFLDNNQSEALHILKNHDLRVIDPTLQVFIGEYLGEHHNSPTPLQSISSNTNVYEDKNLLNNILNIYRGVKQQNKYGVYNVLEIIKRVRVDLSGIDFHSLDLRNSNFYGVNLDTNNATNFSDALINGDTWISSCHTGKVNSAEFSPDGHFIVTTSDDKMVKIWNSLTGALVKSIDIHSDAIHATYIHSGHELLIRCKNNRLYIWNPQAETVFELLTAYNDNTKNIYYVKSKDIIIIENEHRDIHFCNLYGSIRDDIKIDWDKLTQRIISISSHGNYFLYTYSNNDSITLYDVESHSSTIICECSNGITKAVFSPNEVLLVVCFISGDITVYSVDSGEALWRYTNFSGFCKLISFSDDSCLTCLITNYGEICVIDNQTYMCNRTFADITDFCTATFSPNNQLLIAGTNRGKIFIWETTNLTVVSTFKPHTDRINSISFNCYGTKYVTASWDNSSIVWNSYINQKEHILGGDFSAIERSDVKLVENSKYLAVTFKNGGIQIWNICNEVLYSLISDVFVDEICFTSNNIAVFVIGYRRKTGDSYGVGLWNIKEKAWHYWYEISPRIHTIKDYQINSTGTLITIRTSDDDIYIINPLKNYHHFLTHNVKDYSLNRFESCVVIQGNDEDISVWNISTGEVRPVFIEDKSSYKVEYSPCGRYLMNYSKKFVSEHFSFWDSHSYKQTVLAKYVASSVFSNVDSDSADEWETIFDNMEGFEVEFDDIVFEENGNHYLGIDGLKIYACDGANSALYSTFDLSLNLDDIIDAKKYHSYGNQEAMYDYRDYTFAFDYNCSHYCSIFDSNSKCVFSIRKNGIGTIWDINNGRKVIEFNVGNVDNIKKVSFSSNGKYILILSVRGIVRLYDIEEDIMISIPVDWIADAAFLPDSKKVVFYTKDSKETKIGIFYIETNTIHFIYNCHLFIKGIDFCHINMKSNMTKEHWEQFRQYGGITHTD